MEEWVGKLWHRWITKAAGGHYPDAAVALKTLGFLSPEEPVRHARAGLWQRLSTSRGHVLVYRR